MKKRKITVTTGARADYGLLRPILSEILSSKNLDLFLIVTGMHLSKKYGLTINEIKKDGFKISASFNMLQKGNSKHLVSRAIGKAVVEFSNFFNKIQPDINVILGDRDEMLASAISAYHMNIPNAHIHGGDRSGGIDEYTRHAITKISNIHFATSQKSKERILRMGENAKYVFFTGSPAVDEVKNNKITDKKTLESKYGFKFSGNEILFLQHPVTTQIESTKNQITNSLKAIQMINQPTITIAPNSDAGNNVIFKHLAAFSKSHTSFMLFKSLPRSDYLGMLKNCKVLVGNSSSGIIEASYFKIPVVNIGIRQKNREKGSNVLNAEDNSVVSIHNKLVKALKMKKQYLSTASIYGDGNAAKKIIKHLETIKLNHILIEKQISY